MTQTPERTAQTNVRMSRGGRKRKWEKNCVCLCVCVCWQLCVYVRCFQFRSCGIELSVKSRSADRYTHTRTHSYCCNWKLSLWDFLLHRDLHWLAAAPGLYSSFLFDIIPHLSITVLTLSLSPCVTVTHNTQRPPHPSLPHTHLLINKISRHYLWETKNIYRLIKETHWVLNWIKFSLQFCFLQSDSITLIGHVCTLTCPNCCGLKVTAAEVVRIE